MVAEARMLGSGILKRGLGKYAGRVSVGLCVGQEGTRRGAPEALRGENQRTGTGELVKDRLSLIVQVRHPVEGDKTGEVEPCPGLDCRIVALGLQRKAVIICHLREAPQREKTSRTLRSSLRYLPLLGVLREQLIEQFDSCLMLACFCEVKSLNAKVLSFVERSAAAVEPLPKGRLDLRRPGLVSEPIAASHFYKPG